jgi:hypothetical protein
MDQSSGADQWHRRDRQGAGWRSRFTYHAADDGIATRSYQGELPDKRARVPAFRGAHSYTAINIEDELARIPGIGQVRVFGASSGFLIDCRARSHSRHRHRREASPYPKASAQPVAVDAVQDALSETVCARSRRA